MDALDLAGRETLLNPLLVRYASEASHERFKRQIMKSGTATFITGGLKQHPKGL